MKKVLEYLEMIKFEHSVFALPFAYSGAILAGRIARLDFYKLFWITIAMVAARSAAMGFNRFVDIKIDRDNPRTKGRALPLGKIGKGAVLFFVIISLAVFFFSAGMLNSLTLFLSPVAAVYVMLYSYTKRFTHYTHFILGGALGIAPTGAWLGVTGFFSITPVLLSLGVLFWTAGFDILYSIQDFEYDKENRLHSIPVRYGIDNGIIISRLSHLMAFIFFFILFIIELYSISFLITLVIIIFMLLYQHIKIEPDKPATIERAFFIGNSVISIVFLIGVMISVYLNI